MAVTRALAWDLGLANAAAAAVQHLDGKLTLRGVRYMPTTADAKHPSASMDDARRLRELYVHAVEMVAAVRPNVIVMEAYTVYDTKWIEDLRVLASRLLATLGFGGRRSAPGALRSAAAFAQAATSPTLYTSMLDIAEGVDKTLAQAGKTRGRGAAAKVLSVQGVILSVAFQYDIPYLLQTPTQIRHALLNRPKGTKEEIAAAVRARLPDIEGACDAKGIPADKREHCLDAAAHALLGLDTFERYHRQ